ncbi:MAG: type 4a pilus biogenesis protein PilO [Phycisphaeraceae bacterium]|nr:type 4a pilus biogenesis protein PilO [Phycisphaeraceae bacterium]MCW5763706.1 type 4a pilus biogenesis protein PilO [Phycisphaeraceae bacterium]
MKLGTREIITFLIVLMIPVVSYLLVFRPQNRDIEASLTEISHKRDILRRLQDETSRNADLLEANRRIAERIKKDEARLPSSQGVDEIVRQVSGLAIESGLAPPTLKSLKPLEASVYWELPLEMTTSGTFRGFYEFLRRLERLPRITRVVQMEIKRGRTELKEPEITVKFTMSIYFQQGEGNDG